MISFNISSKILREFLVKGPPAGRLTISANLYFPGVEFRPAQNIQEFKSASELVYQEYLKCSYIHPHHNEQKISLFHVLPTTVTFVAIHVKTGEVLGTVTTIQDSPLGLPIDTLYHEELLPLRLKNRHLVEFSMLALNRRMIDSGELELSRHGSLMLLFHLFRAAVDYLRTSTRVDTLVACFHPKHDAFYKLIAMEKLGGLKYFGKVKGNPAVARAGLFEEGLAQGRENAGIRLFFGELPNPLNRPEYFRFSKENLKELFVDHSNILASASMEHLNYIQSCYPAYNLENLLKSKDILVYLIDTLEQQPPSRWPSSI